MHRSLPFSLSEVSKEPENSMGRLHKANAYQVFTPPKESPNWHKSRESSLCCSEIAYFLGLDHSTTRAKIIKKKLGELPDKPGDFLQNMFDWGHALEPVGLQNAASLLGTTVFQVGSLQHDRYPEIQGEPDGVTWDCKGNYMPIEVKTRCYPNMDDATPYASIEEIPAKHWVQVQCYEELLNSEIGLLVNVTAKNGCSIFTIPRDKEFFNDWVVPLVEEFREGLSEMATRADAKELKKYIAKAMEDVVPSHF